MAILDPDVIAGKLVPSPTVALAVIEPSRPIPPYHVHPMSDRLKVLRIYAAGIAAQVI
jgi:hypothetical protein